MTIVTCPICGNCYRLAQPPLGGQSLCPACRSLVPVAAPPTPSLLSRPPAETPAQNRTILAEPEPMIRYSCPRCKKALEAPAGFAGQKLNCPGCQQRLQIPQPAALPAAPPLNKTILATEEPPSVGELGPPRVVKMGKPLRIESCRECGVDVSQMRVETCPDCSALLCSDRCYREHRYQVHSSRRRRRPSRDECYRCGCTDRPYAAQTISPAGWVVFAVLLVFFFPLCWIGLLMTETERRCPDCRARLD
jgi:hypothetical protein